MKTNILKNIPAIIITFALLVIFSCDNEKPKEKFVENEKVETKDSVRAVVKNKSKPVKINKEYNDIAKYLAGIKPGSRGELYNLSKNQVWRRYSIIADYKWRNFHATKTKKIQSWINKEMNDVEKNNNMIFYPFSGPDVLHALTFFPNAKKYLMIGLEPVGTIPDLLAIEKDSLNSYLELLAQSINDALCLSFFKTKDMLTELNNQDIDGTVQIIMLFLSRTNNEIIDIKPVEINKEGNIAYRKSFEMVEGQRGFNKGVEISFRTINTDSIKQVYYFSIDLSNSGLIYNKRAKLFLDKIDSGVTTFIKSASYLMHKNWFSIVRNTIFNKSKYILQDDSGIAFRFFDKETWNIQLYGTYTEPIKLFKKNLEEDLKEAYTENSKPLDFRIGYGRKSNLLLARKK
ncbi:MAG: hypothetical protein PHD97_04120 [Bacteroidales bacterium]|nr:hypothetical protein [Bacteroidales bacterium]